MELNIPSWFPLLMAKVCHDIASPLGALSLGLEILENDSNQNLPTLPILNESCGLAQLKLRFYRQLFTASPNFIEIKNLIESVCENKSISVSWQGSYLQDEEIASLLLGIVIISTDALYRGGIVVIDLSQLQIQGSGLILQWHPDVLKALINPHFSLETANERTILISYLHIICKKFNKSIAYSSVEEHKFSITLS